MENSKTITLAQKLHSVIHHDRDDIRYVESQARYGRQDLSSREYTFNGFSFGNDITAWKSKMAEAGYDPKNMVDVDDVTYSDKDKAIAFSVYSLLLGGTPDDRVIVSNKEFDQITAWRKEGKRLLGLKSERSHKAGRELLEKINDPELQARIAKRRKALHASAIVAQFCWDTMHNSTEELQKSFRETGKYTYKTSWK